MSRSRRLPPLFEVMRETTPLSRTTGTLRSPDDAPPPAPPTVSSRIPDDVIAPPPRGLNGSQVLRPVAPPEEVADEPDTSDESSPTRRLGQMVDLNRNYTVSARLAFAAIGILLAVVLIVWAIAHKVGESAERAKWVPQVPSPATVAPSDTPAKLGGEPITPTVPAREAPPQPTPQKPQHPGPGAAIPATRLIADAASDPRQPGVNYLYIVTTTRPEDASATAEFLSKNGFPAAAAPFGKVETGTNGANNRPGKWRVFVLEGIASSEYKNSHRRAEIETKVKKLGEQWKKDPKGGFNFDSCGWDRFEVSAPPAAPKH